MIYKEKSDPQNNLFTQPTGILILENGIMFEGRGIGHKGYSVGEVCFNTSMTGYQEIMTDPSYSDQIINFTFPHIGNVGTHHALVGPLIGKVDGFAVEGKFSPAEHD